MQNNILFLPAIALFSFVNMLNAQNDSAYITGFDSNEEKSGWTEFRVGSAADPHYKWTISGFKAFSAPECLSHNYPVGGSDVTDDWFVSPEFDFSGGATLDSLRYAFSGFGAPMQGDTIALYQLSGSASPETATTKTLIHLFTDSTYMNDDTWRLLTDIQVPDNSSQSHLAFRYKTVVNWLDGRFDNIGITVFKDTTSPSTSILLNPFHAGSPKLTPNPATDQVRIPDFSSQATGPLSLKLYGTAGKPVQQRQVHSNEPVGLNLASGMYFYQIKDKRHALLSTGKLIVQ